jgi:predicted glycoside hydrolase/deacetylase ChbG (UPF0249 family)
LARRTRTCGRLAAGSGLGEGTSLAAARGEAASADNPRIDTGLLIVADDWGYSERYNEGILEAARAGAIDGAGAMVLREACEADPLLESGVEIGLHLEVPDEPDAGEVARQLACFEEIFGRSPAYIDGHHHRHAVPAIELAVAAAALRLDARVRAVDEDQRIRLRAAGARCADRLIGRISEEEDAMPAELDRYVSEGEALPGVTEWMVHPGRRDPPAGSSFDAAREQDLALVLELQATEVLAPLREAARLGLR